MARSRLGRRSVLRAGVVGSAWLAGCGPAPMGVPPIGTGRFRHGVASFDPGPDRALLWTLLADASVDEMVTLTVARNAALGDVVRRIDLVVRAENGFANVHEIDGLDPSTTYHYAFETPMERSPVGVAEQRDRGATGRDG